MKKFVYSLLTLGLLAAARSLPAAPDAAPSSVVVDRFNDVPVDMATGELRLFEKPDITFKTRGGTFDLTRSYRSQRDYNGPFGAGWTWTHCDRLVFKDDFIIEYQSASGVVPIYPDVLYTDAYCSAISSSTGWENPNAATGIPDAAGPDDVAHRYGSISSIQPLVASGWNFTAPAGTSTIVKIDLTSIGATAYDADHPANGVKMKLSAGGANSTMWGHRLLAFDYVDITSDKTGWTWDDVNAIQARLEYGSSKSSAEMDVIVDTFHLGITYVPGTNGTFKYKPGTTFTLERVGPDYHVVHKGGARTVFGLDGRLLKKIDVHGNETVFNYDVLGRMIQIRDPVGQYLTLSYDGGSGIHATNIVDHLGRACYYSYNGDDLTDVVNLGTNTVHYEYMTNAPPSALAHNLIRRTDPEGGTISVDYFTSPNLFDRVKTYYNALGQRVCYSFVNSTVYSSMPGMGSFQGVAYNASNDISQVFIREGELIQDDSDGTNLVVRHYASSTAGTGFWTNASCASGSTNGTWAVNTNMVASNNTLTASGWLFTVPEATNDIASVFMSVYGTASNSVKLSAGGTASLVWSSSVPQWVETEITSDRTNWTWADVNNLNLTLTRPAGATNIASVQVDAFSVRVNYRHFDPGQRNEDRFYYYDLNHNVIASKVNGKIHRFGYDDRGNLVRHVTPKNEVFTSKFDRKTDRLLQAVDPLGRVTRYEYDSRGNRVKTIDPSGNFTTCEYDRWGNPVKATDALGNVEWSFYDTMGVNVIKTRNKRGFETRYDYDPIGNPVRQINPDGSTNHIGYNVLNQRVWERDAAGVVGEMRYDRNGNMTNAVAASGLPEQSSAYIRYDAAGHVTGKTDALGNQEHFNVDVYGNQLEIVDKLGNTSYSQYDTYNRLVWQMDAAGNFVQNVYDGNGNLVTNLDKRGNASTFSYDANNNVTNTVDKGGNSVAFEYDAAGNKVRETIRMLGYSGCTPEEVPPVLSVSYAVDALNRVTNKVVGVGRPDARIYQTQFDAAGRPVLQTDPSGSFKTTAYDANGNATQTCIYASGGQLLNTTILTYDCRDLMVTQVVRAGSLSVTNSYEYDVRGLKIAEIDPLGNRTTSFYDALKRQISLLNAAGAERRFEYDAAGNKIREINPAGTVSVYSWDAAGHLTNKITGVGLADARNYAYAYDALGRVLREIDPLGNVTSNGYDEEGNLIIETGKLGFSKYYTYDPLGRVTNTVDALGYSIQQKPNGRGVVCKLIDKMGHVTTTTYDAYGQMLSISDSLGNTSRYVYDVAGRKIAETDPRGVRTEFSYDAQGHVTNKVVGVGFAHTITFRFEYDGFGRLVRQYDPNGGFSSQTYNQNGSVLVQTDRRGFQSRSFYDCLNRATNMVDMAGTPSYSSFDSMGNLLESTDALGNKTRYAYDAYGQKISVTDANNQVTRFAYDLLGRLTNVTDALGFSGSSVYDASGNVLMKIERNGATSRFAYDPLGRVTNTVDALGFTTTKTYDPNGNVLTARDKRGNAMSYTYDANGRTIAVTDPYTNSVTTTYDAGGNKSREESPSGLVTTYGYDAFGRLVTKTVGAGRPDARISHQVFDDNSLVVSETDSLGYSARYEYDANGNRIRVIDRRGNSTWITYDPVGRATNTVDSLTNSASVRYDLLGRVLTTTDRLGHSSSNSYDNLGRLLVSTDPEGNTKSNSYDAVGRVLEEVAPNGTRTRYTYDSVGNVINTVIGYGLTNARVMSMTYDLMGRQISGTDALGGYSINTYDGNGNVVTSAMYNASGQFLRSSSSQYDARNQQICRIDPLGNCTRAEYDAAGRKTADIDPFTNRVSYIYNVFGEVTTTVDQLGNRSTAVYDRRGQVIESRNALNQRVRYQYDANGNRTVVIDDDGNFILTSYDALNRVSEINRSMPSVPLDVLNRADVNGDGLINSNDVQTLQGRVGQ